MSNPPPYIEIPTYAVAIASEYALSESPKSGSISPPRTPPQQQPVSPNAAANTRFNLSSMLLNQALSSLPTPPPSSENKGPLLSTRDPLSIPIMSANFRRFIGKCGFVFWLQDRVEEVVMWKKGNVYTGAWIAVYVFLCYFPRLTLMLPQVALLHILFTTYQARYPDNTTAPLPMSSTGSPAADTSPVVQPPEGTPDWFANMQAIQNLMGVVSDAYDAITPYLVHLTWTQPTTQPLFLLTLSSIFAVLPVLYLIPARLIFLALGVTPLIITHPYTLSILPTVLKTLKPYAISLVQRLINDDKLREEHWSRLVTLRVAQNQRWVAPTVPNQGDGWSAANLRVEGDKERKTWSTVEGEWLLSGELDGTGVADIRDLKVNLNPGWKLVGPEDWSLDYLGRGLGAIPDEEGWVYTNDAWLDPQTHPFDEWKAPDVGLTRSRVWMRRAYWAKVTA